MDSIISLKELRQDVGKYAEQVQDGRSFLVMKRSKPLFKITPIEEERWEEVIDFTKIKRGGVDVDDLLKRL